MRVVEREEIERAADSLFALSRVSGGDRDAIAVAVARRLLDIPNLPERTRRAHSLVRVALDVVRRSSRVRHLSASQMGLSHGDLARLLDVERSTAQTIAMRGGAKLPWED